MYSSNSSNFDFFVLLNSLTNMFEFFWFKYTDWINLWPCAVESLIWLPCFLQIPELDFEIPPEAQRGSLSTVMPKPFFCNLWFGILLLFISGAVHLPLLFFPLNQGFFGSVRWSIVGWLSWFSCSNLWSLLISWKSWVFWICLCNSFKGA